ncbi:hypothetical protein ACI3PL_29925, partial [Lacticaseibacillus paracasei]
MAGVAGLGIAAVGLAGDLGVVENEGLQFGNQVSFLGTAVRPFAVRPFAVPLLQCPSDFRDQRRASAGAVLAGVKTFA